MRVRARNPRHDATTEVVEGPRTTKMCSSVADTFKLGQKLLLSQTDLESIVHNLAFIPRKPLVKADTLLYAFRERGGNFRVEWCQACQNLPQKLVVYSGY